MQIEGLRHTCSSCWCGVALDVCWNNLSTLKDELMILVCIYLTGLVIHQSITLAGLEPKSCSKVILEAGYVLQVHIEESMSMELH